jgi:hypothetical protein
VSTRRTNLQKKCAHGGHICQKRPSEGQMLVQT